MTEQSAPAAEGGRRITWDQTPAAVRHGIEAIAGGRVVSAHGQAGGFSPGLASVLHLDNGQRVFAKAVGPERSAEGPRMYRDELRVVSALPEAVPAPKFLGSYDEDGWVALVYEAVDGHQPAVPWRNDELERVLDALTDLATSLTPAPIEALPIVGTEDFDGWRQVAADPQAVSALEELAPWAAQHLGELVELEAEFQHVGAGKTLVHGDLRADNMLLTSDRVVFVDWPFASLGAPHCDLMFMLPSVAMHGTDPQPIVERHPLTRDVPDHDLDVTLAALTGYFIPHSMQPPIPNLPTIRQFQWAQGIAALDWMIRRRSCRTAAPTRCSTTPAAT
ncbi:aminoglycoside phosphotransferase family protein [Flindersiella endophytica]